MMGAAMEPYNLTPAAAAAVLGVHEETLKRWARDRKIHAFRTPGGWWRFRQSDLEDFVAAQAEGPAAVSGEVAS
jgi:excisionase family DNA binding protein